MMEKDRMVRKIYWGIEMRAEKGCFKWGYKNKI